MVSTETTPGNKPDDLKCPRCGFEDPDYFTVAGEAEEIFGCKECPDAHDWYMSGDTCSHCGQNGFDEQTTNICPRKTQ